MIIDITIISHITNLLSVMYCWNKVRMVHCQVMKSTMNTYMNEINSDSSERKYVHLSNGLIQSFEICHSLEYDYAEIAVNLFCENVTLVHCSVVVCNYVLPFFLYLKDCAIISKFGSTVLCGLTRETRLTRHKPIA